MTSKLVVNTIEADTGISSVSFASSISLSSTSVFHLGNAGLNIGADTNINRPSAGVIGFNINGSEAARINANGFSGDGSQLTGLPAGLGTALSTVQTSPLNKLYYTDRILSIGSTVTIDHPASATGAYTQYADILVEDNADLIVADGDDLIPDILGLGGNGTTGAGGAGRLLVDNIVNRSGTGAPTFPNGAVVTGIVTATSFVGNVTGNIITDKIVPTGGVPSGGGGGIIQVLQTVVKTHDSRSGGGVATFYNIPGMSITITPKFATSKILVRYHANISQTSADGNGILRLIKDASTISGFNGTDGSVANGSNFIRLNSHWELGSFSGEYLDTAGGTSAITYQLQWSMESGRTVYLNRRGGSAEYGAVSTITAMEVSA